jgi:hypothetical protein
MISYEHRYIFVHIPKTAGTSIESYLSALESKPVDKYQQFLPGCGDGRQHFYLNEVLLHDDFKSSPESKFFSFSVVRNPWDWFLSLVFYWMRRGYLKGGPSDYRNSFFELLKTDHIDNHRILSQMNYLTLNGALGVDFIARFERLDSDFANLLAQIGLSNPAPLSKLNVSPREKLPYTEYYDAEMREAVAERYSLDIDAFGYTFNQ